MDSDEDFVQGGGMECVEGDEGHLGEAEEVEVVVDDEESPWGVPVVAGAHVGGC